MSVPQDLSGFRWARFRLRLVSREPLFLPTYKGSVLRGGFGHVFRKVACLGAGRGFGECLLKERCPYHYIFETSPPAGSTLLAKMPTAPQPFVIEPPLEAKRIYERGEGLPFHLVLIGRAIDFLPYFIYSFDELGRLGIGQRKGRYTLEEVSWLDATGQAVPIYDGSRKTLTDSFHPLSLSQLSVSGPSPTLSLPSSVSISFLSPTRIKYGEKLTMDCEFHIFFRTLLRRLSLLSYFHCDGEFPQDRRDMVERAQKVETVEQDLRWYDWERYSNRQGVRMRLGGFVGQVTYRGDLEEFLPYLLLGTYTHVGKGATFGLGGYRIEGGEG